MFLTAAIACYLATFIVFALVLWKFTSSLPRFAGGLIAWMIGMILTHHVGQAEGSRLMSTATPEDKVSEEFLASIPDGPNLTAGWITTGWIPLLLAYLIMRKIKHGSSNIRENSC